MIVDTATCDGLLERGLIYEVDVEKGIDLYTTEMGRLALRVAVSVFLEAP